MNAEQIRELNAKCQERAMKTVMPAGHNAAFTSLGLSLLAELAAQVAEANEHLVKLANPPMLVVNEEAPGKIPVMPEQATLRDQFAMAAIGAVCSKTTHNFLTKGKHEYAEEAYQWADAMIEARRVV